MEKKQIGGSPLNVAPFCFGGNVFGWTADEATSFRLLDAYVDRGFDFVDTADVYSRWAPGHSGGESESILGRWFAKSGKRAKIVLATKVGMDMGDGKTGLKAAYIERAVEDSLRRLQTDYIDLYQAHRDDEETPLEETLEAFTKLVRQGKARVIGASNYSAARLAQALDISEQAGLARFECLQPLYNLMERAAFEGPLERLCAARKIGVIPYFSLAAGFLTGKYRGEADLGKSVRGARSLQKYLNADGFAVLNALDAVAGKHGAKPAQVALAWMMGNRAVTTPIASATSLTQLEEILGAVSVRLDNDDMQRLNAASAFSAPS
jgi:aryl-alcohol dehydrogenase-like predicted oxidoreductase